MVAHVPVVPQPGGKRRPAGEKPLVDGCGGPSLGLPASSPSQDRSALGGQAPARLSSAPRRPRGVLPAPTSNRTPEGHGRLQQELAAAQGRDWKATAGAVTSPSSPQTHFHEQNYCHRCHPEALEHLSAASGPREPAPHAQHISPGLPFRAPPLWGGACAGTAYPPPVPSPHRRLLVPAPCRSSCASAVQGVDMSSPGPPAFLHDQYRKWLAYTRRQEPGQNRGAVLYTLSPPAVGVGRQPALRTGGLVELSAVSGASQQMAGEEEAGGSDKQEPGGGNGGTRSMERGSGRAGKEPCTERNSQKGPIQRASQPTERKRSAETRGQEPDDSSRPRKRKRSPSCANPIPHSPKAKRQSEDGSEEKVDPAEMTQEEMAKEGCPDPSQGISVSSGEEADIDSSDSDGRRRMSHKQRSAVTKTREEAEPARAERPAPADDSGKEVPPGASAPSWAAGDQQPCLGSEEDDTLVSNKIVSLWSASPEVMDQIAAEKDPQEQQKPEP